MPALHWAPKGCLPKNKEGFLADELMVLESQISCSLLFLDLVENFDEASKNEAN